MTANQTIDFKKPLLITMWLDTALKKEQEKYKKCPVRRDLVPGYEIAQGWGYVVAGYFLVEQSFKALLFVREKQAPKKHSLSELFNSLGDSDKIILRKYYDDYKANIGGKIGAFPFSSLDDFLTNLDGNQNAGSLDWRYFLIEESRSNKMPMVSVDYLHEITFACTRIVKYASKGLSEPTQYTLSRRLRRQRTRKYNDRLIGKMSPLTE